MNKIDWDKPIELSDGTPARVLHTRHKDSGRVELMIGDKPTSRTYNLDGSHYSGSELSVRNVAEPAPAGPAATPQGLYIGSALTLMLAGHKVSRAGWNGKGMFLYHVPANAYPAQTGAAKGHFGEDALVPYQAYIAMKTADDTVVPWLCSQSDLLATDWGVVA